MARAAVSQGAQKTQRGDYPSPGWQQPQISPPQALCCTKFAGWQEQGNTAKALKCSCCSKVSCHTFHLGNHFPAKAVRESLLCVTGASQEGNPLDPLGTDSLALPVNLRSDVPILQLQGGGIESLSLLWEVQVMDL